MSAQGATAVPKATRDATGGAFDLTEYTVPAYSGPPQQCYSEASAACYVLDGLLAFTVDERTITAGRGGCVLIPPGIPYTFFNPTPWPAKFLLLRALGAVADE